MGAPAQEGGPGSEGRGVSGATVGSSQQAFRARRSAHLPLYPPSAGLSQLLTLEVEGNRLHDGNISPLAFQHLRSLLYLRLDRNRLRTIPPGLPASLQVSWEPRGHKRQSCGRKTGASAHASRAGG